MEEMSAMMNPEAIERVKVLRPLAKISPNTTLPVLVVLNPIFCTREATLGDIAPTHSYVVLEAGGRISSHGEGQDATTCLH